MWQREASQGDLPAGLRGLRLVQMEAFVFVEAHAMNQVARVFLIAAIGSLCLWMLGCPPNPFDEETIVLPGNMPLQMVWIPAGTFMMGSPDTEQDRAADEGPRHEVRLTRGFWNNETAGGAYGTTVGGVYFSEKLLRKSNGGAVGILGDSRNSPSWENSTLTQGFFDAIWPNALPTYGTATTHRRLGDILNCGKMYLMSKVGSVVMGETIVNSDAVNELYLWHCIGDPTLEIWTGYPYLITLPRFVVFRLLTKGVNVEYARDGAVITVFQVPSEGPPVAVGRGVVEGGVATIPFIAKQSVGKEFMFTASLENAVNTPLEGKAGD